MYPTVGSAGEGDAGVEPTGTTDGQGQKFPRSLADCDSTSVSDVGTPLIAIYPAQFVCGS